MDDNAFVNPSDETVKDINAMPAEEENLKPIDHMPKSQEEAYDQASLFAKKVLSYSYPGVDKLAKALEDFAGLTPQEQAIGIVYEFVKSHLDPSDEKHVTFGLDEIYVVQFTYILGNWRAMVSTTLPDGMYYEVIYQKNHGVVRLNAFKRYDHQEFAVSQVPGPELEAWAKNAVSDYAVSNLSNAVMNRLIITVRISSSVYITGCWKALLESNIDELVYEITFDPRKRVAYLDPYKFFETRQIAISSGPAVSDG